MSGITGLFYRDHRQVEGPAIECMLNRIAHRGPDGKGVWINNSVGLGNVLLWTTPESIHENLPLASVSGDLVIAADARIDNRDELWSVLGNRSGIDDNVTDSELILAAYQRWGEDCTDRLIGDFAFVVWDNISQTIFCARDHFGVRPFYYYLSDRLFAFGSEIKAILALPEVPNNVNEVKVAEYLASVFDDTEQTFYESIFKLPPAHTLTLNSERVGLRKYWELDSSKELRLGSDHEYADALCEIFSNAVRSRMRSNFPIGSMLSGGLDSSSITCVAGNILAEEGKSKLTTFSAVFDEVQQSDERPFINAVLSQNNVESTFFSADKTSPLTDLDEMLWHQDEPWSAGNLYISWCLLKSAKKQGVRVVLDGFDGDTTVSHGTGYLIELVNSNRWLTLAKELRAYSNHFDDTDWRKALMSWMWSYRLGPISKKIPGSKAARSAIRPIIRRKRTGTPQQRRGVIDSDFAEKVRLMERVKALKQPSPRTEREQHYQRIVWPLMPSVLEILDRTAAAHSVDLRFPFWDKRLVEFCLALPPEQKLRRGKSRFVMREAMNGILPEEIRTRGGKGNLQYGFDKGLIKFEKELLDEIILGDLGPVKKYVDVSELQESYKGFVSGRGTNDDMLAVWRTASLSVWLRGKDSLKELALK